MFYLPITTIIISSIFLGAIILSLFLPGTQSLLRAKGLFDKNKDQLIYPIGFIWAITSLIPSLLFNQFLIPHSSFLIYLACSLIILLFTLKADLLKLYPLQWALLWLIIAIIINDLGGIKEFFQKLLIPHSSFFIENSSSLIYWLGLLLLFLSLLTLNWLTRKLPSPPLTRSWIMLPSLAGAYAFLWITGKLEGILLLGSMIGANLLLSYLNKHNPSKQFDPGITSITLTTFTLLWITLILPSEIQLWFLIIWLTPLILVFLFRRLNKQ